MSRADELTEQTNAELRELLNDYDLPTDGNKAELVDRIVRFETGLPEAEPEPEADASDEALDPEDAVEDEEVAENDSDAIDTPPEVGAEESPSTVEDAGSEGDSSEGVLIKFTGTSPHYERVGKTFSVAHPYAVVTKAQAEKLAGHSSSFFRLATQGEVERYYG